MRRRVLPFAIVVCHLLVSNISSGSIIADEFEFDCIEPEARLARSILFDQPALTGPRMREVIDRLKSYFRWPSSTFGEVNIPVVLAEGVGEVFVVGDDISTDGITEVEGSVPIGGSVAFGGPVRASGTVTIAGRCAPASGFSPLRIGPPMLPYTMAIPPPPPPALPPATAPIIEVPLPDSKPKPVCEVLPLIEPSPLPTVTLPPVIIPAIVIPAYIIPEVILPASEVYELASGRGDISVTGNNINVSGATYVEGVVPTIGEVTFSGYVPAKGTVTVCSCF